MFLRAVRLILAAVILVAAVYFLVVHPRGRYWGERRNVPAERRGGNGGVAARPHRQRGDAGTETLPEVGCESEYFAHWQEPGRARCVVRMRHGYPVPDARCTPGGVNPTVTADVLRDREWRTRAVRNCAESEAQKHVAYRWYDVAKPRINSNENQICELDHLVPLELGGADGLGNIWPECGPDGVMLHQRYFKQKDHVENYLAEEVKAGRMSLSEAQRGIASDWTQYLNDADLWCGRTGRC